MTYSVKRSWRFLQSGLVLTVAVLVLAGCSTALVAQPAFAESALPADTITTVQLDRLDQASCGSAPVTFGQPFRDGDLPRGQGLHAEYAGQRLPTQVNIKARNADGSARHAVITVNAPCSAGGKRLALVRDDTAPTSGRDVSIQDVLKTAFNAQFSARMGNQDWTQDARSLLERVAESGSCTDAKVYCRQWLSGPLVSEWVVAAPPHDENGNPQPHLNTYFAVRAYGPAPVSRVRVDIVSENNWAYADDPHNLTYDAHLSVPGSPAFDTGSLTHYRQARWHHVLWWGANHSAPLYAALNPAYIQSTPALPRYQNIRLASRLAQKVRQNCAPMKSCDISKHMEKTGAQSQIGPLPRWSSAYVINTNYRLYRWMLANSDAMGAYRVHYRDQETDEPVALMDHPCATTLWPARQARCKAPPHGDDRFPACKGACDSPLNADEAHHPAPTYAAYLATGDWYYAQEMMFWANWAVFWQNPDYRDYATGLVNRTQLRGQAWALRSLGQAAYLLPDNAPLKSYFNDVVGANIRWYNDNYTNNPKANKLGAMAMYHSVIYPSHGKSRTGIATWQQSFFTWATGNLADMGFEGAPALRDWVSRFQVGQMTAPGYCWELGSAYALQIRPSRKAPYYDSFDQVYRHSFPELADSGCDATSLNQALIKSKGKKRFHYPPGTMVGYPKSATGFVANFQVGLAAAANADLPGASKAWALFSARKTPTDYGWAPQFAIAPTQHR